MSHVSINPSDVFSSELKRIQSPFYISIAVKALNKVPSYFWTVPASSSGKYHPKSSLGLAGLVRHVKSVFWIGEELLGHPLYAPFTDEEKDQIRVAMILHDCLKQGIEDEGSHTVAEHPLLVRDHLNPFKDTAITDSLQSSIELDRMEKAWDAICNLIETHMGIWTKDKDGNEILDVPKTKAQLFVHQCDFLASRKIIEVDVTPREAQANYGSKAESKDWRKDLATSGQITYIQKLYVMVSEKGLYHPPLQITDAHGKQVLTKGDATDIIDALKGKLGMS